MHERLSWLTRSYYVSYTAGQILPTAVGGDAVRVVEISRRHPGRTATNTAIVLLERGLGGAATVLLGAIGFLLAIGRYDVGAYLWLEGAFVFGTMVLGFLFFARSARPLLSRVRPIARGRSSGSGRCARSTRACTPTGTGRGCSSPSSPSRSGIQAVRILAIWASAKAVGHRRVAAPLLRDGAAVLPRPARTVHAQRVRGARGLLRQLPRRGGRRPGRGLRGGLPVLPRDRRAGHPGRRCAALGGLRGRRAAARSSMAEDAGRVSAVVVTYNALPWLEACLDSVARAGDVVVDNGSTDGTVELVRERYPEVRLVEQATSASPPAGTAACRTSSGDWFLILNADAWMRDGAVDGLVAFARGAPARCGRRPAAAQSRRLAAALGARRSHALAAGHGVPLPPQARARSTARERVLRGRLRPRRARARRRS